MVDAQTPGSADKDRTMLQCGALGAASCMRLCGTLPVCAALHSPDDRMASPLRLREAVPPAGARRTAKNRTKFRHGQLDQKEGRPALVGDVGVDARRAARQTPLSPVFRSSKTPRHIGCRYDHNRVTLSLPLPFDPAAMHGCNQVYDEKELGIQMRARQVTLRLPATRKRSATTLMADMKQMPPITSRAGR